MANKEFETPILTPLFQNPDAIEVQQSDLVDHISIGTLYNIIQDEKLKFSSYPIFKVATFNITGESTICNMISCTRIYEGYEESSWFNLNYLLAKDEDGIPFFPEYYVINNIQERINRLLNNTSRIGEFSISPYRFYECESFINIVAGYGYNGSYYDGYRTLPAHPYNHVKPIKKFNLKLEKNADNDNLIARGFHLLKTLKMINENKSRFTSNYHIQFSSGFFDNFATFGLEYNEENFTYTIRSGYGNLNSTINMLSELLSNLVLEYLNLLPSNVRKYYACDLYKRYF